MDGVKRALNDRKMDVREASDVLGIGMSGTIDCNAVLIGICCCHGVAL